MSEDKTFSHLDEQGNPTMVNVGEKAVTHRIAVAESQVLLGDEIMAKLNEGDIITKKGPVFQTAITAGIMAAKKTSDLIPLCHPLSIENIKIAIKPKELAVEIKCTVSINAKTGVEMEALTGASVAALTIYDMCKAFSHRIEIQNTRLVSKTGGKNDFNRS